MFVRKSNVLIPAVPKENKHTFQNQIMSGKVLGLTLWIEIKFWFLLIPCIKVSMNTPSSPDFLSGPRNVYIIVDPFDPKHICWTN